MAQQTPRQTQRQVHAEHAVELRAQDAAEHPLGQGMTTDPRGNGKVESRDVDKGVDKLERVLGW
jgi:hypothetical protein